MNESIPSMLQPPQAAQKLRIWLRVSFGFDFAMLEACEAVLTLRESENAGGVPVEDLFRVPGLQAGLADVLDGFIEERAVFVRKIGAEADAVGAHGIDCGAQGGRMAVAHAAVPHALGGK